MAILVMSFYCNIFSIRKILFFSGTGNRQDVSHHSYSTSFQKSFVIFSGSRGYLHSWAPCPFPNFKASNPISFWHSFILVFFSHSTWSLSYVVLSTVQTVSACFLGYYQFASSEWLLHKDRNHVFHFLHWVFIIQICAWHMHLQYAFGRMNNEEEIISHCFSEFIRSRTADHSR